MGLGGNFEPQVLLVNGVLQVSGQSTRLDGGVLVSRHVALQQPPTAGANTQFVDGAASTGSGWDAFISLAEVVELSEKGRTPLTAPPPIEPGPALAIGTETHFVPGAGGPPSATASFVTLTWSEPVTISKATALRPKQEPS